MDTLDDDRVRLRAALRTGEALDLTGGGQIDLTAAGTWGSDRTISAAAIRAVLLEDEAPADPHGLRIVGARVEGLLDLGDMVLDHPLAFVRCVFDEPPDMTGLKCAGLVLRGSSMPGLELLSAHIAGDLVMDEEFKCAGQLRALGIRVDRSLSLEDAQLHHPGDVALALDRARVGELLILTGVACQGIVRAFGASIGSALMCRRAKIAETDERPGLLLEAADIGDHLFLDDECRIEVGVDASRIRVSGDVQLEGSLGEVVFQRAQIGGLHVVLGSFTDLDLMFSTVQAMEVLDPPPRLVAVDIKVGDSDGASPVPGEDDVVRVVSGSLGGIPHPFRGSWRHGRLVATGWRLSDADGALAEDRGFAAAWLRSNTHSTSAQPWHELAAVFERHGRIADGRWLRWQASRRTTSGSPMYAKPIRWLYGAFAGYGYYPLLALVWLVAAAAAAGLLAWSNPTAFSPANETAAVVGFNPWWYGVSAIVPSASTVAPIDWVVSEPHLAWTLLGLSVFGWLQTAILLAGVTGLLRKT